MMISRQVTITKLDHAGELVLSYPGEVLFRDQEKVVVRCPWTWPDPFELGAFSLERGDIFIEYYYRARWFNIFGVYSALGILKGWYCNVTNPPEVLDDEIRWRDLALDLLVAPDGGQSILDEDEFEALQLPARLRKRAENAIVTLREWVRQKRYPFLLGDYVPHA